MGPRSKPLALVLLALASFAWAGALPVPQGFASASKNGIVSVSWQAVEGAGAYRVAFFDVAGEDGKRPLLAAVWVKGTRYVYDQSATVPKLGALKSTKPLPYPQGVVVRAMVAAAKADGSDKSEWAGLDIESEEVVGTETPSPTPSPEVTPSMTSTPGPEVEAQAGEEFKQSPDAAVLDVDEGATEAVAVASTAVLTLGEAKELVGAGKYDEAEAAFKAMVEKDLTDADAWEGLGDVYAGKKMKIEAVEAYEKALKLNKTKTHLNQWIQKNVRR